MSEQAGRPAVGIEKIGAYPCALTLDLSDLAVARGETADYPQTTLLAERRSLNPCWEDATTMAVNAAKPMLTDEDRASIGLFIVGTESSPDFGKPITTFAWRYLDLAPNCRNFECKHACYGGTAGVMMAAHWVSSGMAPGKKALVICTDEARNQIGLRSEYVMGSGAVALLISDQPDLLELELGHNGYWTNEVCDTFRPTSFHEAGNTDTSVYCYLDALEGAYEHFTQRAGGVDFDGYFKRNIYHVPFAAMAYRAHRTLLRKDKRVGRAEAEENFERKVKPSLSYIRQIGGTYSASTYYSLLGLLDADDDLQPGDRIGVFSYGSGSCAEFYSARIGERARELVQQVDFQRKLDQRMPLSVEQYEALERERAGYIDKPTYEVPVDRFGDVFERRYAGQGRLMLRGLKDYFRDYGWS